MRTKKPIYKKKKKHASEHYNQSRSKLHCVNIGPRLADKSICPGGKSYKDDMEELNSHKFEFVPIDSTIINDIITKLKNKSTCGYDRLSNKLLKLISNDIAGALTIIVNQTFASGIFPDRLKIAKVTPVYKKGNIHDLSNYRPISVLPSMSKVFERVMHDQINKYFAQHKLFYSGQYGFRPQHSTEYATLIIIHLCCSLIN